MKEGQRKPSTPGLTYDGRAKTATVVVIVPGTAGRARRQRSFEGVTRDEALAKWRAFRDEVLHPKPAESPEPVLTFRRYVETYWPKMAPALSEKGATAVEGALSGQLLPYFGEMRLEAITDADVVDFVAHMKARTYSVKRAGGTAEERHYSAATINHALDALRKFLRNAVARRVLREYPLRERLPRQKEEKLALELSPEETAAFLGAFEDRAGFFREAEANYAGGALVGIADQKPRRSLPPLDPVAVEYHFQRFRASRPYFVTALETGLGPADLRSLTWREVDLVDGWIIKARGKTKVLSEIPISAACAAALEEVKAGVRSFEGLVFTSDGGAPLPEVRVRRYFALAKRLAGISRRLRLYDLRHSYASRLASQGVSIQMIAKALGHVSVTMSQRYARPSREAMRQIVEALDRSAIPNGMKGGMKGEGQEKRRPVRSIRRKSFA